MARLSVRQNGSCPVNTLWYVCSTGGYTGCCSVDPCTTGGCPDGRSSSSSPIAVAVTTKNDLSLILVQEPVTTSLTSSTLISSETSMTTPSVLETATASSIATTTSTTPTPTPTTVSTISSTPFTLTTQSTFSTPTPSPTTTITTTSSPKPTSIITGALIGGIIGGAIALLLLLTLILYSIHRSRKRREKQNFTLLRWRSGFDSKPKSPVTRTGTSSPSSTLTLTPSPPSEPTPTTPPRITPPLHPPSPPPLSIPTHPSNHNYTYTYTYNHNHNHTPNTTTIPLIRTPHPSSTSTLKPKSLFPPFLSPSQPPPPHPLKSKSNPSQSKINPLPPPAAELSDTGFYRQRAELPAESSRELINIPIERRRLHAHEAGGIYQSRTGASDPIVTKDGAVLAATIERVDEGSG